MKKEILLLVTMLAIIIVAITGWYMYYNCKNNCDKPQGNNKLIFDPSKSFCDQQLFKDIVDIVSATEQLKALKDNVALLCGNNEFNKCVVAYHTVKDTDFETYANDHPDNSHGVVYYNLSLSDLDTFIKKNQTSDCYAKHVNFKLVADASNSANNKAVPELVDYDENKSCYSIPLLSGIIEKNAGKAIVLKFCKSKINGTERVIFSVDDNGVMTGYFDYTVKPAAVGPILSSF